MRTRSLVASLFSTAALVLSACSGGATPSPSAVTASPSAAAATSAPPSASAPASSASAGTTWKVGVVTDVGTVDDKNFNQYSNEGAQKGAADIGAAVPPAVVPKDASEYATLIQKFIDQGYNIIVTVGFNLQTDTAKAAKKNPKVWFVGVDQDQCIDAKGDPDSTFKCAGNANFATLLPNFIELQFAEDQAGYLAGIVAASISKVAKVGAIGGINLVPPVVRYIQGFELGAKSVNPSIVVKSAYVSASDFGKAFNDPATGKTFAAQFIKQNKVDVLFQVAGKTGNGVLDAACAAGIMAIGVDVDQFASYTSADACIWTSAEKHLSHAVQQAIDDIAGAKAKAGPNRFDATNDGIGVSDFHDKASKIPADLAQKLSAALAGMKAGTVTTCPAKCGQP